MMLLIGSIFDSGLFFIGASGFFVFINAILQYIAFGDGMPFKKAP